MTNVTGSDVIGGVNQSADNDFNGADIWYEWIEIAPGANNLAQAGFNTADGTLGAGQVVYNTGSANYNVNDVLATIDIPAQHATIGNDDTDFAVRIVTTLRVTDAGTYDFEITTDSGAIMYIDGVEVINFDGTHASTGTASGSTTLAPGYHDISIIYFAASSGAHTLNATISGPDYTTYSGTVPLAEADVSVNSIDDFIDAGEGDDRLIGGQGDDILIGGDGNDNIDGGIGDDTISGGDGDDRLSGGSGFHGGGNGGNDLITDTGGSNLIFAGGGDDTISITGGVGNNTVNGGDGADLISVLNAAGSINTISAGDGDDFVLSGDSTDTIYGDGGDDVLTSGGGDDTIVGDAGDDHMNGGSGSDTLTGGEGFDTFIQSTGDDTFTDFGFGTGANNDDGNQRNNDFLDLSGYYDTYYEARADLADDGILNQSNPADYSNNTALLGTITLTGTTADVLTADTINVTCFTPGTLIRTSMGNIPIEHLKVGDRVITMDDGAQPIRWIGRKKLDANALQSRPNIKPILIKKDAFGSGVPDRDMRVSPQHRIHLSGWNVDLHFGQKEVLAPAKGLVDQHTVLADETCSSIEYIHILFDHHQVVFADEMPAESFHPGKDGMAAVEAQARAELIEVFPNLACDTFGFKSIARMCVKAKEAQILLS